MDNRSVPLQGYIPYQLVDQFLGNTTTSLDLNSINKPKTDLLISSSQQKKEFPTHPNASQLLRPELCVDTVHLKFPIDIPDQALIPPWRMRSAERKDSTWKIWYTLEHYLDSVKIFMKYQPIDYQGKPLLSIEISSVPNLIYGDNTICISEMGEAIEQLNARISPLLQDIYIDIGAGIFERIDIFYDYFVGPFTADYLRAISQRYYPHLDRRIFTNQPNRSGNKENGISFTSKVRECVFYDQGLKRGKYGSLRQEARLKDTDVIEDATGILNPTLRDITPEIGFMVLNRDLEELGLWEKDIYGGNLAHEILRQHYPAKKAQRLFYILKEMHDHTAMNKKMLSEYLGIGEWTLNKSLRDIGAVGMTPSLLDRDFMLPPLSQTISGYGVGEKSLKNASDTGEIDLNNGYYLFEE